MKLCTVLFLALMCSSSSAVLAVAKRLKAFTGHIACNHTLIFISLTLKEVSIYIHKGREKESGLEGFLSKVTVYSYQDRFYLSMASQTVIQEIEGDYRNGKAVMVRGVRMPHIFAYSTGLEEFLTNFVTSGDDVFIVGFPRSGTTWLQEVTWQILHDGQTSDQPIGYRVPFLDESRCLEGKKPDITTFPSPRITKTHQPFHAVPKGSDRSSQCKYIYVSRNPKDVVVSYFKFDTKMGPLTGYVGPFEFFAKMFIEGKVYWGPWTEHVLGWWKHKDDWNILFLKYEDLIKDLASGIRQISTFLDKPLTEETVKRIAEQCTFESMKKNSSAYWMLNRDNELPNFLRKGEVGGWKDYFTPELNEKFETEVMSKLKGTGLQYDFGN